MRTTSHSHLHTRHILDRNRSHNLSLLSRGVKGHEGDCHRHPEEQRIQILGLVLPSPDMKLISVSDYLQRASPTHDGGWGLSQLHECSQKGSKRTRDWS